MRLRKYLVETDIDKGKKQRLKFVCDGCIKYFADSFRFFPTSITALKKCWFCKYRSRMSTGAK